MKKLLFSLCLTCLFMNFGFAQLKVEAAGVKVGAETTPVEALDVEGAIKVGTTTNANAGTIRWTGTDFEGYDGAAWQNFAGTTTTTWDKSGADAYYIGGNIGIGTNAPDKLFHMSANGGPATFKLERVDFNNFSELTTGTVGSAFVFPKNKLFLAAPVETTATNIALLDYSLAVIGPDWSDATTQGNVGVGTLSATEKLTVNGNVLADDYLTPTPFTSGNPVGRSRKRYGLKEVMKLETKEFSNARGGNKVSFSAEDLMRVVPDLVEEYEIKTYKYLDNNAEMPQPDKVQKHVMVKETEVKYLLLNAIQDQQAIIDRQTKIIEQLSAKIEKIENALPKIGINKNSLNDKN